MHENPALQHAKNLDLYKFHRVPLPVKLDAVRVYLAGASLRKTTHAFDHRCSFSHEALRQWVQAFASVFTVDPARRETVVIDETSLFLRDGQEVYGWVALDPDTRDVLVTWVTQGRSGVEALLFLKNVLRRCTNDPHVEVDAGVWYPWALETLGLEWHVQAGGDRNLAESFFGSLKNRLGKMHQRPGTWHTWETVGGLVKAHAWFWCQTRGS